MALTAVNTYRESMGSLTLNMITFAAVTSAGDTWTGPTGIVATWANSITANAAGNGVSTSWSGTTITITPDKTTDVMLFVASRS